MRTSVPESTEFIRRLKYRGPDWGKTESICYTPSLKTLQITTRQEGGLTQTKEYSDVFHGLFEQLLARENNDWDGWISRNERNLGEGRVLGPEENPWD